MRPEIEILVVSGLHSNEACAPLMAREVLGKLRERGERVALFEVPYRYTLLAMIDDPTIAATDSSMPAGTNRLHMDLDGRTWLRVAFSTSFALNFDDGLVWRVYDSSSDFESFSMPGDIHV